MKFIKFLCQPLVLIIALACNSEEVDVKKENFNSTIESSQKLYLEMMKTQDYEKYKEARNSFVAKLDNKLIFLKTKKRLHEMDFK